MVHEKLTRRRTRQIENELESDRRVQSGVRHPRITQIAPVGVDPDLIVRARPVDLADVEAQIHVGFVVPNA